MKNIRRNLRAGRIGSVGVAMLGLLVGSMALAAQDPLDGPALPASNPSQAQPQTPAATGGWRRVGDPSNQTQAASSAPLPAYPGQASHPPAGQSSQQGYPQQGYPQQGYPQGYPQQGYPQQGYPRTAQQPSAPYPIPSYVTLRPGTYITVRVNQPLSSDHNQAGDGFTATLNRPIVADGLVVAEPGQTIGGRVAEAQKAGRVSGTSRLGLQLTDLTLVDGHQMQIQSQLVARQGNTSIGRDAGAIAATTATGAAIGAAAGWGVGAAIGAGAGAAAGVIGVLLTRGEPTVVVPEQILTFRLETPVVISTEGSPQAYHYIEPGEYDQAPAAQAPAPRPGYAPGYAYAPGYPAYPSPYYYSYGYGYPYAYPYYWGPSVYLGFGGGYYGGYYHSGYYHGGYHGGAHVGHH